MLILEYTGKIKREQHLIEHNVLEKTQVFRICLILNEILTWNNIWSIMFHIIVTKFQSKFDYQNEAAIQHRSK